MGIYRASICEETELVFITLEAPEWWDNLR